MLFFMVLFPLCIRVLSVYNSLKQIVGLHYNHPNHAEVALTHVFVIILNEKHFLFSNELKMSFPLFLHTYSIPAYFKYKLICKTA